MTEVVCRQKEPVRLWYKEQQWQDREYTLIASYEAILIGKQKGFDGVFFGTNCIATVRHRNALRLIQYLCEAYLHWTPQKMYSSLSIDILKQWKLHSVLRYIEFPPDLNPKTDLYYISAMIYPNIIKFNKRNLWLTTYRSILNGKTTRFPRHFFLEGDAMNKLCVCLRYAIDHYANFASVEEMYHFFGTPKCIPFLKKYKLYAPAKLLFDSNITMLYMIVSDEQEIPFLFHYYRFNQVYDEQIRAQRENRGRPTKSTYTSKNLAELSDFNSPLFEDDDD